LIRLKIIGTQWDVIEKLKGLKSIDPSEDWRITYATPVYGGWDLIAECIFSNLEDLDKIISFCRTDSELSQWIEATTTLISTKKNYKE
jgi:DNA-binding Lrp family transcriptional regulator